MDELARSLVDEGVATTVALGVASQDAQISFGARDTYFDLASVTKPFTAVAFVLSGLDRRAPLGDFLEEARGTPSEAVPIELFFAHRAGLDAHRDYWRRSPVEPASLLHDAASARRSDAIGVPPADGFPPLYSDLGYLLAGEALARATGHRDAGDATRALVIDPLGLSSVLGTARSLAGQADLILAAAPTEDAPWRGGIVRGRVHDENAWAFAGEGGAGHAGLFGTIGAVLSFGAWLLDVTECDPRFAWTVAKRPGGTLLAGFDGKSDQGSSAGALAGPRTFGHLGFTGTSLWIDPDANAAVALLTNRVHPTRDNGAIRTARPRVHDALWARARNLG